VKRRYSNEQIEEALSRETNRTMLAVCAEVGCSEWTLKDRIARVPELRRLADALLERGKSERERAKAETERKHHEAIEEPNRIIRDIVVNWCGWNFQQTRAALARLSKAVKRSNRAKRALGISPRRLVYRRSC